MLHYKGMITEQPGIKAEPIGNSEKNIMETLLFYDDELCDESSCLLVQEQLEKHFISAKDDVHVQVYYDKDDERVIIGITIFFNTDEDRSRILEYKEEFERYYNETFYPTKNSQPNPTEK